MATLKRSTWYGRTVEQRFESKFMVEPNTGCFIWMERLNEDGYGQFKYLDTMQQAHRVAWMLYRGEIPRGLSVLHNCDNRPCVNFVHHLYLGTQKENMRDAKERGRINPEPGRQAILAIRRAVTHCCNGHLKAVNWNSVLRQCRVCDREVKRKRRAAEGKQSRPDRWL